MDVVKSTFHAFLYEHYVMQHFIQMMKTLEVTVFILDELDL